MKSTSKTFYTYHVACIKKNNYMTVQLQALLLFQARGNFCNTIACDHVVIIIIHMLQPHYLAHILLIQPTTHVLYLSLLSSVIKSSLSTDCQLTTKFGVLDTCRLSWLLAKESCCIVH